MKSIIHLEITPAKLPMESFHPLHSRANKIIRIEIIGRANPPKMRVIKMMNIICIRFQVPPKRRFPSNDMDIRWSDTMARHISLVEDPMNMELIPRYMNMIQVSFIEKQFILARKLLIIMGIFVSQPEIVKLESF